MCVRGVSAAILQIEGSFVVVAWRKTDSHFLFVPLFRTERTYVRGLQELDAIYIKPSSAPVNLLGNVGQAKETLIPAAERKLVFGGLESLISFHKESFLPALERAAAPLMKSSQELALVDADGSLSNRVAMAVANTFVSSAPFMKMYSSYIKCVFPSF